jgi:hypothetical protein
MLGIFLYIIFIFLISLTCLKVVLCFLYAGRKDPRPFWVLMPEVFSAIAFLSGLFCAYRVN